MVVAASGDGDLQRSELPRRSGPAEYRAWRVAVLFAGPQRRYRDRKAGPGFCHRTEPARQLAFQKRSILVFQGDTQTQLASERLNKAHPLTTLAQDADGRGKQGVGHAA